MDSLQARGILPVITLLESVLDEDASEAERFWIQYFRGIGLTLANGTDGGEAGYIVSQHSRDKMSQSHRGKVLSDEHREKLRRAQLGRVFSAEHRENCGKVNRGRKRSPESVERIRISQLRRRESIRHIDGSASK
jgi:hypothetical protein